MPGVDNLQGSSPRSPQCTDCEETCPTMANELTEQCTDQCVVIACRDPSHDVAPDCSHEDTGHCNLVCDSATNCVDCNGFDAFLQCCNDYHEYFSDPKPRQTSSSTPLGWDLQGWDMSFNRDGPIPPTQMGGGAQQLFHSAPSSASAGAAHFSQISNPASPTVSHASFAESLSHESQYNPYASDLPAKCMWSNCSAAFPTLSDLIGHVNLVHLHPQQPNDGHMPPPQSIPPPSSYRSPDSSVACLWNDCTTSVTPQNIPGPSSAPDVRADPFSALEAHLMQDHLGINTSYLAQLRAKRPVTVGELASLQNGYPSQQQQCSSWSTGSGGSRNHAFTHQDSVGDIGSASSPLYTVAGRRHPPKNEGFVNEASVGNASPLYPGRHPQNDGFVMAAPARPPEQNVFNMIPPPRCRWQGCEDDQFPTFEELLNHLNSAHANQSQPSCFWDGCNSGFDMSFDTPNPLHAHLLRDHLNVNPTEVNVPSQHHNTPSPPISNSSTAATTPPPADEHVHVHKCLWQGCSMEFPSCDELTAHLTAVHVGGGKAHYECFWESCNRNGESGFSSKQKICRHLQSHTGHRPFQCKVCQQNFSEAATLQQHMRRHTQERPYACDFPGCGKSFAIMGALTIHKRIHNGLKPFKCKYCEKTFSESSNLSKHLRTHTGARPYICLEPGCGKSFARPDQLNRHLGVHKKSVPADSEAMVA